jgi:hypothetical protein
MEDYPMDWDKIQSHEGHEIEIVTYGPKDGAGQIIEVWNIAIECITDGEVIADSESDGLERNALVNEVRANA